MTARLDANSKLERMEARLCWCGAAGSGESHASECAAGKFDRIPPNMTAAQALKFIRALLKQEA
jgi:hypothetical protein